ncbi:DNA topoisomerase, partial [Klebsiella pneumoniae]
LKLVIDREKEILNFVPQEYWTISSTFKKNEQKSTFNGDFYGLAGKKIDLTNNDDVRKILAKIDKKQPFEVTQVIKKER